MISHNRPTLGRSEREAAARVLSGGWVAQGKEVEAFENQLCQFFNLPEGFAVAVSSGSSALFLALWALSGKAKRIGLPVYACAALRNAVGLIGGQCVYLDCAAGSPNTDMTAALRAGIDILVAPSMFGIPVELPVTRKFQVIEDIAQSLGAIASTERIGLRGDIGICSFYATKMITAGGQGGAVISRNKALIDMVRDYREFDCRDDDKYRFNFQMTDLQAAIGRVQLERLPAFIAQRERWIAIYRQAGLELVDSSAGMRPVRYRIVMRCPSPKRVIAKLANEGICAIVPVADSELLDKSLDFREALTFSRTTVSLPAYPSLQEGDVIRIARIAKASE